MSLEDYLSGVGLHKEDMARRAGIPVLSVQHACRGGKIAQAHADAILKVLSEEFRRPIRLSDIDRFKVC